MPEDNTSENLRMLEKLSVSYYLQECLEETYSSKEDSQKLYDEYIERITAFSDVKDDLKKNETIQIIATPRSHESICPNQAKKIAKESASYFKQGLEMLRTARFMHENSKPLVEYYCFLQCVKGIILLELDINKKRFFQHHGLKIPKTNSRFISAKILTYGVFPALLLRIKSLFMNTKDTMKKFFSGSRCFSLEEVLKKRSYPHYSDAIYPRYHGDPFYALIGSWMFSSLVRYFPEKWQEIRRGESSKIISEIREFQRNQISVAIGAILFNYADS